MKRIGCVLLAVLLLAALLPTMATAEDTRPILVLEKMELSKGLQGPFGVSVKDDEVTPAAVGAVERDPVKGEVLHISDRSGSASGLSVNLKDTVVGVGSLDYTYGEDKQFVGGEYYALTFSIRAAAGESFYIMPVMGGGGVSVWNSDHTARVKDSNGYLGNIETRWKVTDSWTTVGVKPDGTLAFFAGDNTYRVYQPNLDSWCGLYFVTFTDPAQGIWNSPTTADYYVADMCFWGPQALVATADGFVTGCHALPPAEFVTADLQETLERLTAIYNGLSAADKQRADVVEAREALNRAGYTLSGIRRPFAPTYTCEDATNLLAPYGDLESFDGSTYIWSEAEGVAPQFTLIQDASVAKQGNNCLLISKRQSIADVSFNLTEILRAQGGGDYAYSCYIRAADPSVTLQVMPLLLYVHAGEQVDEFEIGESVVRGDEWTFVGVTYEQVERCFRAGGKGLPDIDDTVNYASLRLYVTDTAADPEYDENLYPDYYIDDMRFWKQTGAVLTTTQATTTATQATTAPTGGDVPADAPKQDDGMLTGILIAALGGVVVLGGLFAVLWLVVLPRLHHGEDATDPDNASEETDASGTRR